MLSKINPDFGLYSGFPIVSIVKHGEHAIFLIEEMVNNRYSMYKTHFIPAVAGGGYCVLYGASLEQLIANKTVPGRVQKTTVTMHKPIAYCSREEIFTQLKLTKYIGISFKISRNQLQPMLEKINVEARNPESAPKFNIKGTLEEGESGHNCCTWVLVRSALAGIDVREYLQTGTIAYCLRLPVLPSVSSSLANNPNILLPANSNKETTQQSQEDKKENKCLIM